MKKVSYKMNLPADVDQWIRVEAAMKCRSRSGEIIFILRERMDQQKKEKGEVTASKTDFTLVETPH